MKISIITATYNSGSTLRDTLESVLAQDYADYEHIIVDGASKDDTMDIVREYEPKYKGRLRYISEPDHGIYDAMNKGIEMAEGEIIGILNSDDFFSSKTVLSSVTKNIEGYDAVYADIHYVNKENLNKCVRYYSSSYFRRWMMRFGFMPAHPSFYCRKHVYKLLGNFNTEFKVAADFEQLLRLIFVNRIVTKYVDADFVTMRTGGASTSGFKSHRQILKDHIKAYKTNNVYSNYVFEGCRYMFKVLEILWNKRKYS